MAVREGLLALLQDEARYGYELKTAFESTTGGVWKLNVGQVYTTLDRLERDELVTVALGKEDQKLYSITTQGRNELGAWWTTIPTSEPPPRDELMLKVLFAIKHSADHGLSVVTQQRTALTELLQLRRRDRRAMPASGTSDIAAALVTDALIVRAEADLRWLDLCESRILTKGNS